MPLELLHRFAREALPVAVTEGGDVDAVRILALAGHVRADIPKPVRTLHGYCQPPAMVLSVTALGQQMIQRFPRMTAARA
ncbi:MAG: hypothetical protein QM586_07985 [Xenophilus sp.]